MTFIFTNSLFQHGFLDGQIVALSQDLLDQQMPRVAGEMIDLAGTQAASFRFTLLSIGLLLFGAVGLFVHTKRAFHIIWQQPDKVSPLKDTIFSYMQSYLLVGLVAFLLLVTSIITALVLPAEKMVEQILPIEFELLHMVTFLISFSFVTVLFSVTYRTLIEEDLQWIEVFPGSILTALLFTIGNLCIEAYAGFVDIGSAYGAAGSLAVFLFWVYYSAQIFLFGAEVIKVQKRN